MLRIDTNSLQNVGEDLELIGQRRGAAGSCLPSMFASSSSYTLLQIFLSALQILQNIGFSWKSIGQRWCAGFTYVIKFKIFHLLFLEMHHFYANSFKFMIYSIKINDSIRMTQRQITQYSAPAIYLTFYGSFYIIFCYSL